MKFSTYKYNFNDKDINEFSRQIYTSYLNLLPVNIITHFVSTTLQETFHLMLSNIKMK